MSDAGKRRYALADFSVELRARGWYFGRQFEPAAEFRGPYASIASVTLMIARQLRREVERRDSRITTREAAGPVDEPAPPL